MNMSYPAYCLSKFYAWDIETTAFQLFSYFNIP